VYQKMEKKAVYVKETTEFPLQAGTHSERNEAGSDG
jgi:hypothetical protein